MLGFFESAACTASGVSSRAERMTWTNILVCVFIFDSLMFALFIDLEVRPSPVHRHAP